MKIILISYTFWPPDFGGAILHTVERLETLAKRGYEVMAVTSGRPGYPNIEDSNGIRILRSPVIGSWRAARLVRRAVFWAWACLYLLRNDFDVLHLLGMPGIGPGTDAVAAWSFCRIAHWRRARTVTAHTLADTDQYALDLSGLNKMWKSIRLRHADCVVAVSPALYRSVKNFAPHKAVLLPNGVRDDVFRPLEESERARFREERELPPDAVVFAFVGTVGRRKGFDLLASAFRELACNHPAWRLWVVGPHTRFESQNLETREVEMATEPLSGLESRVTYWGRIDSRPMLATLLGASDVFVFASRREGMGVAPLQAMAVGTPVIVTRIAGVTDLANVEGVTGFYVRQNDVGDLVRAMRILGEDQSLRRSMGNRAAQHVRQAFGWSPHVDKWEALYRNGRCQDE